MIRYLGAIVALFLGTASVAQERPIVNYPANVTLVDTTLCDTNPTTYESINTTNISLTSGSGSHTDGAFVSAGTNASEWVGFRLFYMSDSSSTRSFVDVYAGGTTPLIEDYYASSSSMSSVYFPVAVPAGTNIQVRMRSSAGSRTANVFIIGQVRTPGCPAGYTKGEALNAETAASRAGTTETPINGTYVEQVASTSRNYSALLVTAGTPVTATTVAGILYYTIAKGAAGSEVDLGGGVGQVSVSNGVYTGGGTYLLGAISAGTRLSMKLTSPTSPDTARMGIMGFY